MRRYYQGTLDFACGIYAVINALACTHALDLASARWVFQESTREISSYPEMWRHFLRNETDHYWVVRFVLRRFCLSPPFHLRMAAPFGPDPLRPFAPPPASFAPYPDPASHGPNFPPNFPEEEFTFPENGPGIEDLFLPEYVQPQGPVAPAAAHEEAVRVWNVLADWLAGAPNRRRAAIFRFHRFLPGFETPIISHWTTGQLLEKGILHLHDASSEPNALIRLERQILIPAPPTRALVRIVPESLILVEPSGKR